jgi:mono/diheme cytochrome c family protein
MENVMRERITSKRVILLALGLLTMLLSSACRQDMHDQPKYKLYRESNFPGYQKDQAAARPLPENTVARGHLNADKVFYTGKDDSATAAPAAPPTPATPAQEQNAAQAQPNTDFRGYTNTFPMPVTKEVLDRGQDRFNIYCTPCHGKTGVGNGMVVQRGYKQPPSYFDDRLRNAPVGYFYSVITEGFGAMPDYSGQLKPEDRWAVVAYLRALQSSRGVKVEELTPEQRKQLESSSKQAEKGEGK